MAKFSAKKCRAAIAAVGAFDDEPTPDWDSFTAWTIRLVDAVEALIETTMDYDGKGRVGQELVKEASAWIDGAVDEFGKRVAMMGDGEPAVGAKLLLLAQGTLVELASTARDGIQICAALGEWQQKQAA